MNDKPSQPPQHHPIKGQSPAAQAARIDKGCCPVHGIGMPQIASWGRNSKGQYVTIGECPRRDCGIRATMTGPVDIVDIFMPGEEPDFMLEEVWQEQETERLRTENAELRARLARCESEANG